jgi:hypothetical protein
MIVSPCTISAVHLGKAQRFPDRKNSRFIAASLGRFGSPVFTALRLG